MNDDDLRAMFQKGDDASAPEFSAVLDHKIRRYRVRPAVIALTVVAVVAVLPLGWLATDARKSTADDAAVSVSVPTTDWLLAAPDANSAPQTRTPRQ